MASGFLGVTGARHLERGLQTRPHPCLARRVLNLPMWGWASPWRRASYEAKPSGRQRACSRLARMAGERETGLPGGTYVACNASRPPAA